MYQVRGSSYFCEDLRTEDSNQPMLIGLLSPAFEIEGPYRFKSLYFVSMLYVGSGSEPIDLELTLEFEDCAGDVIENNGPFYGKAVHSDEKGNYENLAIVSLPLGGLEVDVGSRVAAKLVYGDKEEIFTIDFVQSENS